MQKTLNITKSLADGSRLRVIMALSGGNEMCLCQITEILKLAPATVSRHMSVLQNASLVQSRKEGRWVHYRLAEGFPPLLLEWLKRSLSSSNAVLKDNDKLTKIIDCNLDELCRTQKSEREAHNI